MSQNKTNAVSPFFTLLGIYKVVVAIRCITDIFHAVGNEASLLRTLDLTVYVVMLCLICLSLFRNQFKRGVYYLIGYLGVAFVFNLVIYILFIQQNGMVEGLGTGLLSWVIGIVIQYTVLIVYFRRHWSELK